MLMSTCAICLETLKAPTAFPCGHVFCYDCVARTVRPLNPLVTASCPTCRAAFPIVTLNAQLIPPHLRPYFLSPFRRLYLDAGDHSPSSSPTMSSSSSFAASSPCSSSSHTPSSQTSTSIHNSTHIASPSSSSHTPPSSSSTHISETARLKAENATLRQSCLVWRRRAEAQAAAGLGLTAILRLVKEQVKSEREEVARREAGVRAWVEEMRAATKGVVAHDHDVAPKIEEEEKEEEEHGTTPLAPLTLPMRSSPPTQDLDISPLLPPPTLAPSLSSKRPFEDEDEDDASAETIPSSRPLSKKKRLWIEREESSPCCVASPPRSSPSLPQAV